MDPDGLNWHTGLRRVGMVVGVLLAPGGRRETLFPFEASSKIGAAGKPAISGDLVNVGVGIQQILFSLFGSSAESVGRIQLLGVPDSPFLVPRWKQVG